MTHLEQTSAHISKLPEAFSSFWPFLPGCRPSRREKSYFSRKFWAIHVPPLFTYRVHSRSFLLVMVVSGFSVKAEASHSAFSVDFCVAEVNIELNFPTCIANKIAAPMDAWSITCRKDGKDVAKISCNHSLRYKSVNTHDSAPPWQSLLGMYGCCNTPPRQNASLLTVTVNAEPKQMHVLDLKNHVLKAALAHSRFVLACQTHNMYVYSFMVY